MHDNRGRRTRTFQPNDDLLTPTERTRSISPDNLLSAVANEHQRAILNALNDESDNTLEYDALVDRVANMIRDEGASRVSDEHRRRVRIALHHTHLPKLEEARIIGYVTGTDDVEFIGGELEQSLLAAVESYDTCR